VTVLARRIASVPRRTSVETWQAISELLAPAGTPARTTLDAATGPAAMLIAEEATRGAPIIVSGGGPQLRVYTLHGEAAMEADLDQELSFPFIPTAGDWALSLPASPEDLEAVGAALAAISARLSVRDRADGDRVAAASRPSASIPTINTVELERP
jgi:hypothetical protein